MKIEYSEVLICYGDSNTYGFDPEPWSAGRYPEDSRWSSWERAWESMW